MTQDEFTPNDIKWLKLKGLVTNGEELEAALQSGNIELLSEKPEDEKEIYGDTGDQYTI